MGVPISSVRCTRATSAALFSSSASACSAQPAPPQVTRTRRSHSAGEASHASGAQNEPGGMRSNSSPAAAVTAARCASWSRGSSIQTSPVATAGTPSRHASAKRARNRGRSAASPRTPSHTPPALARWPFARTSPRPISSDALTAAGTPAARNAAASVGDSTMTCSPAACAATVCTSSKSSRRWRAVSTAHRLDQPRRSNGISSARGRNAARAARSPRSPPVRASARVASGSAETSAPSTGAMPLPRAAFRNRTAR